MPFAAHFFYGPVEHRGQSLCGTPIVKRPTGPSSLVQVYKNSLTVLLGCYFGKPYKSVQEVYEMPFTAHCTTPPGEHP